MKGPKSNFSEGNISILIIEDNLIFANVLKSFLENLGFSNIRIASTGKESLKLVSSRRFSLIFLDFHLPDMNGIEFCRHYQKISKDKPPIICCSTVTEFVSNPLLAKQCIEAGIDDFIGKPIMVEQLEEAIEIWLPRMKRN